MHTAYVIVTILAAAANIYAASNDFNRPQWIIANMTRLGVPQSWIFSLGAVKAIGSVGLLVGIRDPMIGLAASGGLVLFFVGATITTIRAQWYSHLPYPVVWLLLTAAALTLRFVTL